MSAKATAILWIACAAGAIGCAAMDYQSARAPEAGTAVGPERAGAQRLAEFNAAIGLVAELRFREAAEGFARVLQAFEAAGDDARAGEATFWMGYCYEKRDRPEEAAAFYRRVASRYGHTPAAAQAAQRLSRLRRPGAP